MIEILTGFLVVSSLIISSIASIILAAGSVVIILRGFKETPNNDYIGTLRQYMMYSAIILVVFWGTTFLNINQC